MFHLRKPYFLISFLWKNTEFHRNPMKINEILHTNLWLPTSPTLLLSVSSLNLETTDFQLPKHF